MSMINYLQKKLIPELVDLTEKRYNILRTIEFNQPIGRRNLANVLGQSERWVRSELDVLKEQNLIEIQPLGMTITQEGREIIDGLRPYIAELKGLSDMEKEIKDALGVREVIIVPGDVEKNIDVLNDIGKASFEYLKDWIKDSTVIAVSGGYTLLALADKSHKLNAKDVTVVPARGGIKADLERQANIVAAKMAKNIGGSYYLLHLPDNINEDMLLRMTDDPDISKVLTYIQSADVFIFGMSSFEAISKKRNFTQEEMDFLKSQNVRAEAFGCYFNKAGDIVYKSSSIGIKEEYLKQITTVMAVGGGASKAESIILVNKGRSNNVIVTDETAAREIYNLLQGGK